MTSISMPRRAAHITHFIMNEHDEVLIRLQACVVTFVTTGMTGVSSTTTSPLTDIIVMPVVLSTGFANVS